jgi:hypothetical protein
MEFFKTQKFLIMVLDTVISLTLFFVSKNVPNMLEDVKFLIGALQPMFIAIITAVAVEGVALTRMGIPNRG